MGRCGLGERVKKCYKCKIEKLIGEFHRSKRSKDGHVSLCKSCRANYVVSYLNKLKKNGPSIIRESKKCPSCNIEKKSIMFYKTVSNVDGLSSNCKECARDRRKNKRDFIKNNPREFIVSRRICCHCKVDKKINEFNKNNTLSNGYQAICIVCQKKYMKLYRNNLKNNGKKINRESKKCYLCKKSKQSSEFYGHKLNPDGLMNICKNCNKLTTTIKESIKRYAKNGKTKSIIKYGINIREITESIGPKPDENYHLDHILPLHAFDYNNDKHIRASWHPNNLRWLPDIDNLSKNGKYNKNEFNEFIKTHAI